MCMHTPVLQQALVWLRGSSTQGQGWQQCCTQQPAPHATVAGAAQAHLYCWICRPINAWLPHGARDSSRGCQATCSRHWQQQQQLRVCCLTCTDVGPLNHPHKTLTSHPEGTRVPTKNPPTPTPMLDSPQPPPSRYHPSAKPRAHTCMHRPQGGHMRTHTTPHVHMCTHTTMLYCTLYPQPPPTPPHPHSGQKCRAAAHTHTTYTCVCVTHP